MSTTLTVERKDLLAALTSVMPAVAPRGDSLSLTGVKITARKAGSSLSATNLDLALDAQLEAKVAGRSAEVIIDARRLRPVVLRGLPPGTVTITLDRERPSLSGGRTTVWFDALPLDGWPKRREIQGDRVVLSADDVAVIKRVAVAASDYWARPILHSVCLGDGYAVATDSYRLIAGRISTTSPRPLLLPLEMIKVLPVDGVELVVEQVDAPTVQHAGDIAWSGGYARLVAGEYPNWSGLMPEPDPAPLVLDRAAFLGAVLRAEAVISAADRYGATPLCMVPAAGGITLSATWDGKELLRDGVELFGKHAGAEPLACNVRFLAECLRSIKGPRVRLSIRDSLRPFLISPDTDDAEAFRALLMPVRVDKSWLRAAT